MQERKGLYAGGERGDILEDNNLQGKVILYRKGGDITHKGGLLILRGFGTLPVHRKRKSRHTETQSKYNSGRHFGFSVA